MAQFLKGLFADEMDAERLYLQKKIEELVHAEVLPPIEEEKTLIVFAGSHPLGQIEQEVSEVFELAYEDEVDEVSAELPLIVGTPLPQNASPSVHGSLVHELPLVEDSTTEQDGHSPEREFASVHKVTAEDDENQWLDSQPDWASRDLELSLPTSIVQRPVLQDQPSISIVSEETNPEFAMGIQMEPQTEYGNTLKERAYPPSLSHHPSPTPEPIAKPAESLPSGRKPSNGAQYPSPLFETIQQLQDNLPPSILGLRATPSPSVSHAEAHRNASYVGPKQGLSGYSNSPTPAPPTPIPSPRSSEEEDEQTHDSAPELTVASALPAPPPLPPPSAPSTPSLTPSPNTPLFVPMTSQPQRNGDIPLVLSLAPDEYQKIAQIAAMQGVAVPQVVRKFVTEALLSSSAPNDVNAPPCHSDPRSHRLAATKKD